MPRFDQIDPTQICVRYHRDTDALYVHFSGKPVAATSVDLNEYLYLRVSRETHEVVGLQFDSFLSHAVRVDPRWLWLGELAGIPGEELAAIRDAINPELRWQSLLRPIFDEIELASA
jgi:hypothetical protein